MFYNYNGTKVYYEIVGNGKTPIVFLHGWGGSVDSFKCICKDLTFDYKALFIDFPPFGKSDEPNNIFTMFDYQNIVEEIMNINYIKMPTIVGHSFGGRVAILLANKCLVSRLVLVSSAGIKPKRTLKYKLHVLKNKILKRMGIKKIKGSKDYEALNENMKKTFSNIVSTFLEKYAININVPTILFWGKKDKETPIYMAKKLKKLIKDSEIIAYSDAGHFCYLEKYSEFVAVINSFAK